MENVTNDNNVYIRTLSHLFNILDIIFYFL